MKARELLLIFFILLILYVVGLGIQADLDFLSRIFLC